MSLKVVIICCSVVALAHAGPRVRRLANGQSAEPGQYPYYVSLIYKNSLHDNPFAFCGGAILNDRWILTAAYCIKVAESMGGIVIKAGNIYQSEPSETEQLSDIVSSFMHPQYDDPIGPFDVALLKLATPLIFNEFVAPIKLPPFETIPSGLAKMAGLGSIHSMMKMALPRSLKSLNLDIIDNQQCQNIIDYTFGDDVKDLNLVDSLRFCTKPTPNNQGYCLQDTGNVLISERNGKMYAVGIATFGFAADCETPGAPSIFTQVSAVTEWIESTITQSSRTIKLGIKRISNKPSNNAVKTININLTYNFYTK